MNTIFTFFNKKNTLKISIQGNNPHIVNPPNPKISKFGMPKQLTPKSQAKINLQFPQYPYLTIF